MNTTRLGQFAVAVCHVMRPAVFVVVMLLVSGMASPVAGAPPQSSWRNFQFITFNQGDWGGDHSTAANLLTLNFFTLYPSGFIELGLPGTAGFSVVFFSSLATVNFLPQLGLPGQLNADIGDPSSTSSGSFGGDVLALRLNIDLTDAGLMSGTVPLRFGDLRLCNFGQIGQLGGLGQLNGLSVRQMLPIANTLLGGGTVGGGILELTVADIAPVIAGLNGSFGAGFVSEFAQAHLCR